MGFTYLCLFLGTALYHGGLPGAACSKEPACQCGRLQRHRVSLWVGKVPRRRNWQPTPVVLPGESRGQRSLEGSQRVSQRVRYDRKRLSTSSSSLSRLPQGPRGKNSPADAGDVGDMGSIPGSGRAPGEGNGHPLQCSCLENPMDGAAWRAGYSPWGRKESDTAEQTFCPRALPRGLTLPGVHHPCWPELTAAFWAGCLWQASWCFSHAHASRKLLSGTQNAEIGHGKPHSTLCVCVCFKVRECSKLSYLWNLLNFQWISTIVTFSLRCRAGDWERCRPTDRQTDRRPSWARAVGQAEIPSRIYRLYLISSPFANRCPCSKWKNFERSAGV